MQNDASTSFLFSFIHEAVDRTAFELTSSAEYGYIFLYFLWAALVVGGGGDGCQGILISHVFPCREQAGLVEWWR